MNKEGALYCLVRYHSKELLGGLCAILLFLLLFFNFTCDKNGPRMKSTDVEKLSAEIERLKQSCK